VSQYLENRWTDLRQIQRVDVFGPSLGGVWMPRSKVYGQGHQGQKRAVHSNHPRQRRNGTRSLQMTSRNSRRDHSVAAGVWFRGPVCGLFGKTSLAVVLVLFLLLTVGQTWHETKNKHSYASQSIAFSIRAKHLQWYRKRSTSLGTNCGQICCIAPMPRWQT